jgi:putative peptide zinc metalloprotease protein
MSTALHSGHWHRVAGLTPKLRPHVRIHRHRYRGVLWYVVEDRVGGKHHRFALPAYRVIANLDGRRSLQQIWDALLAEANEDTPTQDDILQLIGQLNAADLIVADASADVAELAERRRKQGRQRWVQRLANPLALRIPLFDPDPVLSVLQRLLAGVPGGLWAMLGLLPVAVAAFNVPLHWPELTRNFGDQLIAADNLLLLGLAFILMKVCHELAHGLALKRRGAEVHEMGVMFLLFYPVPYVDASGASAFVRKWDRVWVGAAGMAMEIVLASLAMLAWMVVEPGLLRSLLYNIVVVGTVSTVVFNANPLLRFDGYYMLMDAIEVPNLGQRSNAWWISLLRRRGFGIPGDAPEATSAERRWFIAYAPAALAYRVFITLTIAWFIGQQYFFVGVLLAAWSLGMGLAWPLLRGYGRLLVDPQASSRASRVALVAAGGPALLLAVLFVLPLPHHTRAQGVLALPERAILRAGAAGFVQEVMAAPGQPLQPADAVLLTRSDALQAEQRTQAAAVEEARAQLDAAWGVNPAAAARLSEVLRREQAALARVAAEIDSLTLRAAVAGQLLLDHPVDLPGRYLRQGEAIGYVVGAVMPVVRVPVTQAQVDLVRGDTRSVSVRLPQAFAQPLSARLVRAVPGASAQMPSPALGPRGGGPFTVDPRDETAMTALQTLFEFEVELPGLAALPHLGSRAYVAFEHPPEPLGWRMLRLLRRQLLTQFEL